MIITRLIGGLGNQLFQYAVARHLAEINDTVVKLDISGFEKYKLHKYSLSAFNIQENFATPDEIKNLIYKRNGFFRQNILNRNRTKKEYTERYIKESQFSFMPDTLDLDKNIYLDGYWQSEKYFDKIKNIILDEFTVKNVQLGKDKEVDDMISSIESVSVHIRRCDYVNNSKTNEKHGSCDLSYYHACVKQISMKLKSPHFFIFSDDIDWVKNNLKLSFPTTIVDHNSADKAYEDLRLMSHCKHNIIANSTFSWWGAWLNKNQEKIVIAPKKWFNDNAIDTSDLIPSNWLRI